MSKTFKAPRWGNEMPTPVAAPTKKKLTADAAVAMLDESALSIGQTYWDEDAIDKLGIADKRSQKKVYEETSSAVSERLELLANLMETAAKSPKGRARLLEIVLSGGYRAMVRMLAKRFLSKLDAAALKTVATKLDPSKWDGRADRNDLQGLRELYAFGTSAAIQRDPAGALKSLSSALSAKVPNRTIAILAGVRNAIAQDGAKPDALKGWIAPITKLISDKELSQNALMALAVLPPDPIVIEPTCLAMGKTAKDVRFVNKWNVIVLGRVADARAVPYLIVALQKSWMHFEPVFEGFGHAGDPATIPIIEEWLKKNGDGPKGERTVLGKRVIAAITKKAGAKPKGTSAKGMFDKKKPERERPALVYAKPYDKPKKPNVEPIAKQEKLVTKLFANAKLSAYQDKLVKRALVLSTVRVDETKIPVGANKMGGHPDLPPNTSWPHDQDKKKTPFVFLAQIDLSTLPKGGVDALPKKGLLSIFVNAQTESDRYAKTGAVLYSASSKQLERTALPDGYTEKIYQACTVTFSPVLTTPHHTDWHVADVLKTPAEREAYKKEAMLPIRKPENLLLGYRAHSYETSLKKGETLLFQVSSNDLQTEMEFGDQDALSIFIDEKALAKVDFSKVRAQLGD